MKRFITEKYLLLAISTLLFIIPIILMGDKYIVGGDDMKLYYLFPKEYLTNFAFNLITDNTLAAAITGYGTVAYFAPLYAIIWFLKTILPFINTQAMMYGLNFALGFLCFYKLLGLYIKNQSNSLIIDGAKIISSIAYIFSPFLSETLYSHQMMHIYLVSIVPAVFFLFIKSIRDNNVKYALASVLTFSLLSTTLNSVPYFGAYLVCFSPLLLYECLSQWRIAGKIILISTIAFTLLNLYWIYFFILGVFDNTGLPEAFSGPVFENENIRVARGVSTLFSPLNQIFQTMQSGSYKVIHPLSYLNVFYLIIIILAVPYIKNKKRNWYPFMVCTFILSWFFFSPNFGTYGPDLFVWLTQNIPAWGMFRNMYDKFAPAFALSYGLVFGISFVFLVEKISFKRASGLILCAFLITSTHVPRILNPYIPDRLGLSRITSELNTDFWDMTTYLKSSQNQSRVLFLPLNVPTYSHIQDTKSNASYDGLAALRVLADRNVFTGQFSFLTQEDIFLGEKIFELLKERKYQDVGEIFAKLNIRYIVIDHQSVATDLQSFYFGGEAMPIRTIQNNDFYQAILGSKIRDFGERYSLYEIAPNFQSDFIELSDSSSGVLTYKKVANEEYTIDITQFSSSSDIIFYAPYNRKWQLSLNGQVLPFDSTVVYNYANKWSIDKKRLEDEYSDVIIRNTDGSINVSMHLTFAPRDHIPYILGISIATGVFVVLYLIFAGELAKKIITKSYHE